MAVSILRGESLQILQTLPTASVQCVVTSPPYWGLRDYGVEGQLGLEPTPEEYVAKLVGVFREVKRVLRDDGTVWLNLGDSYASGKGTCYNPGGGANSLGKSRKEAGAHPLDRGNVSTLRQSGLKPKDLVGIPWMVAFALRDDGWWLRSDIIWHKPNPMPESVTDRCTKAHEYVFMLTKSARYFYDQEAVKEPCTEAGMRRLASPTPVRFGGAAKHAGYGTRLASGHAYTENSTSARNRRDVWTIATQGFPGAHFAVMPPDLAEICIRAGTSERGYCPKCGAPWERVVKRKPNPNGITGGQHREPLRNGGLGKRARDYNAERAGYDAKTVGWQPACDCEGSTPVPCTVLDPFGGAGTTGLVADRLGRDAILIELNPEYCEIARKRIESDAGMWAKVNTHRGPSQGR